ncbi:MAG: hypothetical protein OXC11_05455, partial [Rhodospirillales bacterium]|nr:hypothetical protein [Rhodospirillales bacterium]
ASDAKRSPIYRTDNLLRIGVDQGAGPERLPATELPGFPDVQLRHGTIRDGAGASELQSYLSSVQEQYSGLDRRLPGYEVRVIGSSSATERRRVLAAVQLVNAALPESAKLSVGTPLPGFSLKDTVNINGLYFGSGRELANTIHVEFIPEAEFYSDAAATSWGEYILMSRGTFPAYADERNAVILLAHELIHSLGIDGHVPERFDSIMETGNRVYDRAQGSRQPASLLYPIDREALRALYGPLLHSTDPNRLGPWSDTSEHLFVGNAHGAFGVAMRNGYAEPWAYGTAPTTDLASNPRLTGSVNWRGALVGFTPAADRVGGYAGITVNLPTMTGSAVFDSLVTIRADGQTPRWRDGDLHYSIAVRGNTFRETGGDDGRLTGIFAGRSHEAAGGTLERSDLTAAFGASR